jgi:Peptidase propeptide and YPEB domain
MTRTLGAALLAALVLAGVGTAAAALPDDPARPAPATVALARAADDTTTSSTTAAPAGTTTADEAGRTAVTRLGGGTVAKVEREDEHGRAVWEVDVRRGGGVTRVHVDVATGAVSRVDDRAGGRRTGTPTTPQRAADDHGRHGRDDGPTHDRGDDHGRGGDDGPGHDRGDDHGGRR